MLGLERLLAEEEPHLADGTTLSAHQVDALSGTLIALESELLISRNGKDWTAAFPDIAAAAAALPITNGFLDGEVCIVLPDGRTSFQRLQNAFAGGRADGTLTYFVFDLLRFNNERLHTLPLIERKARLRALVGRRKGGRIRYAEHVDGDGDVRGLLLVREVVDQALRVLGLEGDDAREVALEVRVVRVEALGDEVCVMLILDEEDGLSQPVATRHLETSRHQVLEDLVHGVLIEEPLVDRLGLDAVSGRATARLSACVTDGGVVCNYGSMSGEDPVMSRAALISGAIRM